MLMKLFRHSLREDKVAKSTWLFPRPIAIHKVWQIQGVACQWLHRT